MSRFTPALDARAGGRARRCAWPTIGGRAGLATLALAAALGPLGAAAHGPVHGRLRELSEKVARNPRDAELRLRRARAYLEAEHAAEAAADLRRALALAPALHAAHYFLGEAELLRGRARAARAAAERFLAHLGPDDAGGRFRGLALLARALAASGQPGPAAEALGRALALAEQPRPEDYLAHADLLERAGKRTDALATLAAGIARLGAIVTLERRALELELAGSQHDAALQRLARMIEQSPQPAALWLERAELLERLGRSDEAARCYAEGRAALAALPPAKRTTPAFRKLAAQLEAKTAR